MNWGAVSKCKSTYSWGREQTAAGRHYFQVPAKHMCITVFRTLFELLQILYREFKSRKASGSTADSLYEEEFISQDWIVINATSLA